MKNKKKPTLTLECVIIYSAENGKTYAKRLLDNKKSLQLKTLFLLILMKSSRYQTLPTYSQ